jgi:hypothetical protein
MNTTTEQQKKMTAQDYRLLEVMQSDKIYGKK